MKTKKLNWLLPLALLVGLFLGYLFFGTHSSSATAEQKTKTEDSVAVKKPTIWTCSMHPQIRKNEPGKCPICGMDLIPLSQEESQDHEAVKMSPTAIRLADIQTMKAGRENAVKSIRLNGKIVPDERLVKTQPAHVGGRIEQLLVNTTGESVRQGQKLAVIYSPQLVVAQQELLQAYTLKDDQPALYRAAREKLKSLRISDQQIQNIEQSGKVQENISIYADRSGIVLSKMVNVGDYLKTGEPLFTIADLSKVWAVFDAYEGDLPFLKKDDKLSFSVTAFPGEIFEGKITFIDPVVNPQSRVAEVRVEINNPGGKLKPEMFATATVDAKLGNGDQLVIPKSAVMWTGERSVVYVKLPDEEKPTFQLREVDLGPSLGNAYVVNDGLKTGEEVVINGTFTVDAAAQLAGKPSMMNSEGGSSQAMDMNAPSNSSKKESVSKAAKDEVNRVLQDYFKLKDALVTSDKQAAAKAASAMEVSLKKVDMESLSPDVHHQWMGLLTELKQNLARINNSASIDIQRKAFVDLSAAVVEVAKLFGPFDKPVYELYCPMADNNNGATWLSASEEIINPYYGDMMLHCGKVKSKIQ